MLSYDKHLIKRCLKKDRKAQNQLYKESYNFMMAICWRYASSKEQAIELVNLGFLKVLLNLKKYKPEVPFELWLRRVVINEVIDQLRKNKKYKEVIEVREEQDLPKVQVEEKEDGIQEERIEWIRTKSKELPNVTGRVFNLYAFDGYKHQEIAQMLNISEGTSQWHYSIAKQKLREWSSQNDAI
ncbi:MAG: RNA polymerase sigma factor [Flavobacteriales bacterium]